MGPLSSMPNKDMRLAEFAQNFYHHGTTNTWVQLKLSWARDAGLIFNNGGEWSLTEFGRTFVPELWSPVGEDASQCPDDDSYLPPPKTLRQQAMEAQEVMSQISRGVLDVQIGGDHYKAMGNHQPWEVLATWMTPEELRGYMKGTVIAYLAREQQKGGDLDIKKAMHTMELWQQVRKDK